MPFVHKLPTSIKCVAGVEEEDDSCGVGPATAAGLNERRHRDGGESLRDADDENLEDRAVIFLALLHFLVLRYLEIQASQAVR